MKDHNPFRHFNDTKLFQKVPAGFLILMLMLISIFPDCSTTGDNEKLQDTRILDTGWVIQDWAKVADAGNIISSPGYNTTGWYAATVPATILAALVRDSVFKNIYYGKNLEKIPKEPFLHPWWFRKTFNLENNGSQKVWLRINGIIYRANVWLNGQKVADADTLEGVHRIVEIDITPFVHKDMANILAIEVFPSHHGDLSIGFVDWNPWPPDNNLGIWQPVELHYSDFVHVRYPQAITKLNLPSLDTAQITLSVEVANTGTSQVKGTLEAYVNKIKISRPVRLAPHETKKVVFDPEHFPLLTMADPPLWWPYQLGPSNLIDLDFIFKIKGETSDKVHTRFGIRETGSYLDKKGHRVFTINGKPILIRGGGWTDDLLLADTPDRLKAKILYAKAMNLNTIRLEGLWGTDDLYRICDEEGILLMAGWSCWWDFEGVKTPHQMNLAEKYWRDQLRRLRNHPSIFVWLYASDQPPVPKMEKKYLTILEQEDPTRPYLSSATARATDITGPTGVKMNGPYEWVPPVYWYADTSRGGAFGFSTEVGPGPEVPPLESVKKMIPPDHLWPIDEVWNYHCGKGNFDNLRLYTRAIARRYGQPTGIKDYCRKAQAINYEGIRAMFEAYGRNKFKATGVIQWMLNSAWPSMIWQLYDYYLMPGGAFFGAQRACEPVHIQYSYDDHTVWIVNNYLRPFEHLKAQIDLFDINSTKRFNKHFYVSIRENESKCVMKLPEIKDLSETYFLRLLIFDRDSTVISRNFYWLSRQPDVPDYNRGNWYVTPTKQYADMKELQHLPTNIIESKFAYEAKGKTGHATVTLKNTSNKIAFLIVMKLKRKENKSLILPIYWEDNYISLMPGEERTIKATFTLKKPLEKEPILEITGWNIRQNIIKPDKK